jgi:small acid-soluble spore protein D (minor alpha/beta-type SASP)
MDRFKMQAAQEVGVNLQQGYNASLTSREAGDLGGQMVKNVCSGRTQKFERISRISAGYVHIVEYITAITV